jgi:hypothetical protein
MWLDRLLKSEPFLADARNVAAITDDMFSGALGAVEQSTGFVGWRRVHDLVREHVPDEHQASSLASFIMNFSEVRRDLDTNAESLARDISSRLSEALTSQERTSITTRLPRMLSPKQGIERQAKVEAVVRSTGGHVDEFSLVSDLRPIFDESREKIEGFVPMTTLRIVVHRSDDTECVEVRITEDDLNEMCAEAERAKRKLLALKRFVKSNEGVELPESTMTLSEASET